MPNSVAKLTIRCVEIDARYVLQFEGAKWSEAHPTCEAAVLRAGQLVVEETELTVYDKDGQPQVVTTLFPLPHRD